MTKVIPVLNTLPTSIAPADVEFFDPPMCCPTGLCGPTLDQALLDVSETIMALQRENVRVERYQMTSDPNAFLANAELMKLIREKQMEALPIVVASGWLPLNWPERRQEHRRRARSVGGFTALEVRA